MTKPKYRLMTEEELTNVQQLHVAVNIQKMKAELIKNNTALVPNGQSVAEVEEAIARLMENAKNQHVSSLLMALGYEKGVSVDINLHTGAVSLK